MNCESVKNQIIDWMTLYARTAHKVGFVVGVSGGVDSGLVSTLCAMTKMPVWAVSMPIHQEPTQHNRSLVHCKWLESKFLNVSSLTIDLTKTFDALMKEIPTSLITELSSANTRSRLRMTTLMNISNARNMLVAGTGNKVEDYGVCFFTKFGDGGIDFAPIGDLLKGEVRELAHHIEVLDDIADAEPIDGLWGDNRSDEQQIGTTYVKLDAIVEFCEPRGIESVEDYLRLGIEKFDLKDLKIYFDRHNAGKHKLAMPPICRVVKD
jgi:NAD+ synthase